MKAAPKTGKTRRAPTRSKATVNHSVSVKSYGKELRRESASEVVDVLIRPGEARVSVGHSIKYWASDQNAGMTIDSMCNVSLPCEPTQAGLDMANDAASELAYTYMKRNGKRVESDMDDFLGKKQ